MNPGSLIVDGALWVALPVAILAGLVSFLSPCVLPLVPGYLGFISAAVTPKREVAPAAEYVVAGSAIPVATVALPGSATPVGSSPQSSAETTPRGRLLVGVLLFIAGFTVVFVSINMLGGAAAVFFAQYGPLITRIMGVVIIMLGLVFLGLFGLAQRTARPRLRGNLGMLGAPLLGFALGVGWTPCIGPTLAAILTVSWNLGDPGRAALLGLAYSAGLGIPFMLLAMGFGWATRSVAFIRRHLRTVNIIGGVLLIALGMLMVTGLWSQWMSLLQGVMQSVPLPL